MNRLQVGDECYVRQGDDKSIHKASVISTENGLKVNVDGLDMWVNYSRYWPFHCSHQYRLIYPFPCVKELAV